MDRFFEFILTGQLPSLEESDAQMDMYRKLTMILHPDRDKGDEEAMKTVNAAKDKGDWRTIAEIYRQYVGEPPEGVTQDKTTWSVPEDNPDEGDSEQGTPEWEPPDHAFGVEGEPWRQKAAKYMEAMVEELDQYLSGDVYGYIIEDEDDEIVDSVWGFYGYDYCKQEAQRALDWLKKEARKKKEKHEYSIRIEQDEDPVNPYEDYDHAAEIVHWHRRGFFGDSIRGTAPEWIRQRQRNGDIVLPLYLYDHSGQRVSTHPFGDRWDSGQVGYIWITKEKAMEEWGEPETPQVKQIKKKA